MGSLSHKAARGGAWMVASSATTATLGMAQVAVLARWLTPSDFGLMGMVMAVVGLAEVLADMGLSAAVIQRKETSRQELSSLYWTQVLVGAGLFAVLESSTPLIVRFYARPELRALLGWMACMFLVGPFGTLHRVLLRKHMRFRLLAIAEIGASTAGVAAAIGGALAGAGVYALVCARLVNVLALTVLAVSLGTPFFKPMLRLQRSDLRSYLRFGSFQLGEQVLNFASWNLDKLLIGKLLGAQALGFYEIAWSLMLKPLTLVNQIINKVTYPLLSTIQDEDERVRRGYLRVIGLVALLDIPIYLGLFAVASPFLTVYLGEGWQPAVPVLRILCLLGILHSLGNPVGNLILAKGRADLAFYMNLYVLALTMLVLALAAPWGVTGIASGLVLAEIVLFMPVEACIRWIVVRLPPLAPLRVAAPYFTAAAIMAGCVLLLDSQMASLGPALRLALLVPVGATVYAALVRTWRRQTLVDLVALWRARA